MQREWKKTDCLVFIQVPTVAFCLSNPFYKNATTPLIPAEEFDSVARDPRIKYAGVFEHEFSNKSPMEYNEHTVYTLFSGKCKVCESTCIPKSNAHAYFHSRCSRFSAG